MKLAVLAVALFLSACTTTSAVHSPAQQLTGEGGDVRVDAQLAARPRAGDPISIEYVITNERPAPITIADVPPQTAYDLETNTVTVKIGAVRAGAAPAHVRLAPGEKKSFSTTARLTDVTRPAEGTLLRLQVNFVDDGRPESVYTNAIPASQ